MLLLSLVNPRVTAGTISSGWKPDTLVDTTSSNENPSMATASNGTIYVAYEHFYPWDANHTYNVAPPGHYGIRVYGSTDQGTTWSYVKGWYYTYNDTCHPSIAIDPYNNRILVAYELILSSTDHDILCSVSNPSTGTWNTSVTVDTALDLDEYPCITSEYNYGLYNQYYIAYERVNSQSDIDLVLASSMDHGATWTVQTLRGASGSNVYMEPSIATAEQTLYIAYRYGSSNSSVCHINVDLSMDRGLTWNQHANIAGAGATGDCSWPSVAATHGGHYAIIAFQYAYSATDADIHYAYSINRGATWTAGPSVAISTDNETRPAVVADGTGSVADNVYGYVYLAYWRGSSYLSTIEYRRAFCTNMEFGFSLAEVITDMSAAPARSYPRPAITTRPAGSIGGCYPCVAWTDDRTSYSGIYYSTTIGDSDYPTIDQPYDIIYVEGYYVNGITWQPSDINPFRYAVIRDGYTIYSGPWDGNQIYVDVYWLPAGTYTYVCTVFDVAGHSISDTVSVTVEAGTNSGIGMIVPIILGSFGIFFVLFAVIAVAVSASRKRSAQSPVTRPAPMPPIVRPGPAQARPSQRAGKFCPFCGASNRAWAKFCKNCGASLDE
jgi:hypothetical protein